LTLQESPTPKGVGDVTSNAIRVGDLDLLRVRHQNWNLLIPRRDLLVYYETFVLRPYASLKISEGDRVLDAGASIGDFTLEAAQATGDTGCVVALEPDPFYYSILSSNLKANDVRNCIPLRIALADKAGSGFIEANTLQQRELEGISTEVEVSTISVEDLLLKTGLPCFDVIKLDIEGWERLVFRKTSWLDNVREISMETHGDTYLPIVKILESKHFGISLYQGRDMVRNIVEFVTRHPGNFIKMERISGGMAFKRFLKYVMDPKKPPQIVSKSDTTLRIVHARRS
jgi:FkbM family methyltransferase